jgi:ParB/RepB/Spo0J family partition protein
MSETTMMPTIVAIPRDKIRPNEYNPNEFNDDIFNELVKSIEEFGVIQPLVVGPLPEEDEFDYEVIDGEHRWTALDVLEVAELPCIIADIDQDRRKFLTVRTYKIRGKFNHEKFRDLVSDLMERHSFEEVAEQMAFTDPDELSEMIAAARDSLDDPGMKKDFDKAKGEIKTVDDLTQLLNRLFTRFGDTLPANFMMLDFGGKKHLWVRMKKEEWQKVQDAARDVMALGYTFDSYLSNLLANVPTEKWVEKHKGTLEEVSEDEGTLSSGADIDDILTGETDNGTE